MMSNKFVQAGGQANGPVIILERCLFGELMRVDNLNWRLIMIKKIVALLMGLILAISISIEIPVQAESDSSEVYSQDFYDGYELEWMKVNGSRLNMMKTTIENRKEIVMAI